MFQESLKVIADFLKPVKATDLPWVLEDVLTPSEIIEIWERIALLRKLNAWDTQRTIAGELSMSVTTVSRGSRVLKFGTGKIAQYL